MNFVRYTVIFGGYDTLRPTKWSGFCISDGIEVVEGWTLIWDLQLLTTFMIGPHRRSRLGKILPLRYFAEVKLTLPEFTLYHDGNVELLVPPEQFLDFLGDCDIAAFRHPQRECVYDEAAKCIECLADEPSVIQTQVDKYRSEGYPESRGLFVGGVLVRRDTPQIRELSELWWQELQQHSCRDQLSLNYALWKLGIECATIPGHLWDNQLFRVHSHG